MRWGWIWDNPAERAHRIVTARPELNPPTPEELRTLSKYLAADDPALHTFRWSPFTGGRRVQLLALRWPRRRDAHVGCAVRLAGPVRGASPLPWRSTGHDGAAQPEPPSLSHHSRT